MILSTLRASVSGTPTSDVPELREESRGRACLEVPARIGMVSLDPAHREALMNLFEPRHWRRALIGLLVAAVLALTATPAPAAEPAPAGRAVMAWHVTISPSWFDPSTAPPQITPFGMLYAIHDALVRPYPGQKMGPSLAESWEESEDGLTYQLKLRPGLKFHNGDPVTTEDVKFSFERYQGTGAQTLKDHVREADIAYALDGTAAEGIKDDPSIKIVATKHASCNWIEFTEQWDPKSPWHDKRLRLAVNYALDRQAISEVGCLGFCPPAGVIVPRVMDFALQVPPHPYDPQKARQLLAEAGYPNGLDAGEFTPIPGFSTVGESALNNLNAVGIRVRMRLMERASFYAAWQEKKLRGLFLTAVGNSGNAATRVETFMYSKGPYAYGGYPDLDEMFLQQSRERDPVKREAILHRIQQLTIDRVMYAPIMDLRGLIGIGPRLSEHTMNVIPMYSFPSYEDMRLKAQ